MAKCGVGAGRIACSDRVDERRIAKSAWIGNSFDVKGTALGRMNRDCKVRYA